MEDRADRNRAQWRRERPELDTRDSALGLRIVLLGKYIEQRVREELAPLDLQPWELDVLAALRRHGESGVLSAGALARSVVLTSSAMTHRITRLEGRGLVVRVRCPQDRRSVLVRLTDEGRRLADWAVTRRSCHARRMFSCLQEEERESLEALLRRLMLELERDQGP